MSMCVGLLVYDLVFVGIRIEMYGVREMCVTGTGRQQARPATYFSYFRPQVFDVTPLPSSKRTHDFK
jgi:hypothetical protein